MRLIKILGALVGAVVAFGVIAYAKAQSRYDADQSWIRQTLREERKAERRAHRERHALTIEYHDRPRRHHHYRDRWRDNPTRRHYYAAPTHRHYDRDRHYDKHRHDGTRVYGIVQRRADTIVRDATGHVECFPALEARSHERQTEDNAWDDAQRSWQNTVRWKYGERVMNIQHATRIEKRCNVSTVSESVAGKLVESVRGAVTGDDNGRRWRCEIRASPCMAPVEKDPAVKGDR